MAQEKQKRDITKGKAIGLMWKSRRDAPITEHTRVYNNIIQRDDWLSAGLGLMLHIYSVSAVCLVYRWSRNIGQSVCFVSFGAPAPVHPNGLALLPSRRCCIFAAKCPFYIIRAFVYTLRLGHWCITIGRTIGYAEWHGIDQNLLFELITPCLCSSI